MKVILEIKKMMIKILIKALELIKGQDSWESILKISLTHMNYGNGGDFDKSGELNVLKHIKEKLDKNLSLIIFDVGGNTGNYAKALSDFFKARAIIYSFEPSKKTYELLSEATKNIQNIISINIGFSDKENNQLLYTNHDGSVCASVYKRNLERFGISFDKSEEIKLTTIDNYCAKNNIDRIHFLKLDIEGHELEALKGAIQLINNRKIDFIQFEFGQCNIDSKTYFLDFYYLLKNNYHIYRILKDGLFELKEYQEIYEIFKTTNYLAIKK